MSPPFTNPWEAVAGIILVTSIMWGPYLVAWWKERKLQSSEVNTE